MERKDYINIIVNETSKIEEHQEDKAKIKESLIKIISCALQIIKIDEDSSLEEALKKGHGASTSKKIKKAITSLLALVYDEADSEVIMKRIGTVIVAAGFNYEELKQEAEKTEVTSADLEEINFSELNKKVKMHENFYQGYFGRYSVGSMPTLEGSEKQVSWAQTIRYKMSKFITDEETLKMVKEEKSAVFYIENRDKFKM